MKIASLKGGVAVGLVAAVMVLSAVPAQAYDGSPRQTILQGLLGAGVGALSAEGSGGKAGTGALIGAGSQIIGGALMTLLTEPSSSGYDRTTAYVRPVYTQVAAPSYTVPVTAYEPQPVVVQQPAVYSAPVSSARTSSQQVLKQGLLGAGVGALSAELSGGKAGTGALVGAGTQIVGGALMTLLTEPSGATQATAYVPTVMTGGYGRTSQPVSKKIVRHYDTAGNLVSEEEFWS